jgi:hypothetical protein
MARNVGKSQSFLPPPRQLANHARMCHFRACAACRRTKTRRAAAPLHSAWVRTVALATAALRPRTPARY